MGYFQVRYNSRVVNYERKLFIRMATDVTRYCSIHNRERMLLRAGFGRYLAALEIIRQSPSMDL